ncbi:MAG TPA: hypothetical protein VKB57_09095 [Acidimicrobiales bacterium]|nr:hypothetical protein [Acidimicrobiales bacterium]
MARDPRRTVVAVAAGLALAVLAVAVNRQQALSHGGGWFAYSPHVAAWTGIALRVYRRRA